MVFTIPVSFYMDDSYNRLRRGYLLLLAHLIKKQLSLTDMEDKTETYFDDIVAIEKSCYDHALEVAVKEMITPELTNCVFEDLYITKIVRVTKNMDPSSEIKDDYLIKKIINRDINLEAISKMRNEELSPKHNMILIKRLESRKNQKLTYKVSSFYRCGKCKVPNTVVTREMQLRSGDEASSISCHCHPAMKGCGHKWIIN
jgi:DNA-directed RNA polymerase subunit M/transcription elongation factor TFIIS